VDHNNLSEIQLLDLSDAILNEIKNKLGDKDFVALYFVCKKFQLLLGKNKPILSQFTISNIEKSIPLTRIQSYMLKSITIENYIWTRHNFEDFISLKTFTITDCSKVDPSPNDEIRQLILPSNLKIFKCTSTFKPQSRYYNRILIDISLCVSLQGIELNGTLSNKGIGTLFILMYPFTTCVQTISCSNTRLQFVICDHTKKVRYSIPYFENWASFLFSGRRSVQLWVNNSVNPSIKFLRNVYYVKSYRFDARSDRNRKEATLKDLLAIHALQVDLLKGQSIVLTFVYLDTSISSQKWRYTYGRMPRRLPDN